MPRGHIRQRSSKYKDSWTVYLYLGVDPDSGKKRYKTEVVRGTKREAQKRLTELLGQLDTGTYVEPSRETVENFLGQWFRDYAETHVRQRTLEGYRGNLDRYIIPALGSIALEKLAARHIQSFESDCLRRGLSPQTVLHCHRIIFQVLRWGVKMGILGRNVAEAVDPPRPQRREAQTLDWEGVRKFPEVAQSSSYYPLFLMALLTGLRRSELLALRWQDVEMEMGTLSVNRSLVKLRTGELIMAPPKSGKPRGVHLPLGAVACLKRVRERREADALRLGQTLLRESLVFSRLDGSALLPDSISHIFGKLAAKAGLKGRIRLHDLRHTHASLMLAEGIHLKVVSERLGHSGIGITGDLYSHVLPGLQREAVMQWGESFENFMGSDLQKIYMTETSDPQKA